MVNRPMSRMLVRDKHPERRFAVLEKFRRRSARPEDSGSAPESLPPVDQIREDDDVSRFMQADVSEGIRREALRQLFRQPKFNLRDGLDDYDDDYHLVRSDSHGEPGQQS